MIISLLLHLLHSWPIILLQVAQVLLRAFLHLHILLPIKLDQDASEKPSLLPVCLSWNKRSILFAKEL